jgi:hypothetical protein
LVRTRIPYDRVFSFAAAAALLSARLRKGQPEIMLCL